MLMNAALSAHAVTISSFLQSLSASAVSNVVLSFASTTLPTFHLSIPTPVNAFVSLNEKYKEVTEAVSHEPKPVPTNWDAP